MNTNYIIGTLFIMVGIVVGFVAVGILLLRVMVALGALSLINHGLRLRGLPPLQMLIPMMSRGGRWF